ncbi:MAG: hypothetical protein Phog2KO_30770 [Phototrophicaceae bacterium]
MSEILIDTIFRYCNDVDVMRHFYTELVGLEETYYRNDEEHGWLSYQIGKTQLVFTRSESIQTIETAWAKSPAYTGGTKEISSWVISLSQDNYEAVLKRLKASSTAIYDGALDSPELLLIAQDPMGMTLKFWLKSDEN